MIESFSVCITDAICKEVRQRITILHWLLNFECDHDLKSILNFLNSKNTESTFENTILYKTQYHCHFQSNSYTWEWWEIYCISNTMRTVWTANNVIWFEEWI